MQHRFYGSPVKSPIGESSFITHVRCALINFTLKYKINSKNNDSIHDPHLFYVHILLTTFPHTPSTRSITHRFLSLEGEHMYIAIPPSNTQHSVSHKCCYRNSLGSKRFQSSCCAKVTAEAKKRLKGEGEGRRGSFFPLPLPRHSFFLLLFQLSRRTSRGNACYAGYYRNHLFLILLLLQTTEKLNTSLCWLRSKGYHLVFFVSVLACENIRLFVRKKRIKK